MPATLKKITKILFLLMTMSLLIFLLLFLYNTTSKSWITPEYGTTENPAITDNVSNVKIMAFNIAKGFAMQGFSGAPVNKVQSRLDQIANLISDHQPDIVCLSEINFECAPCPINQVTYLANKTRMHAWAFGENYNWGLPFYRIRSGNAILSNFPLSPITTMQLAGDASFYFPINNRRILWAKVEIHNKRLLLASLRNDSFNIDNNFTQAKQIITFLNDRPAILAGDFNATPDQMSIKLFQETGLFSAAFDSPNTFPSDDPQKCIDFVLAPASWRLVKHQVIASQVSDHLPVISEFVRP